MLTQERIKEAIKHATSNETEIKKSKKAGCYYCLKVFDASEVIDYLTVERTALCPYCTIDSVLSDSSGYNLDTEILTELHNFWFK